MARVVQAVLRSSRILMKRGGELVGGKGTDTHTAPAAEAGGLQQAGAPPALSVCCHALPFPMSIVKHGIMPAFSSDVPSTVS